MIAQFTENTSAIKIRGKAVIYTKHGVINSGKNIKQCLIGACNVGRCIHGAS